MLGIYSKVAVPTTNVAPAPTPLTPQEAGLSEKEIHDYTKMERLLLKLQKSSLILNISRIYLTT